MFTFADLSLVLLVVCGRSLSVCVCVVIESRLDLLIGLLSLIADTGLVRGRRGIVFEPRMTQISLSTDLPFPTWTKVLSY